MSRSVISTPILRMEHGVPLNRQDVVAVEEPLEISIDGRNISITMRTPGNDEELAAGFLFCEGILRDRSQVSEVVVTGDNRVNLSIAGSAGLDLGRLDRHFYTSSSCGVCGKTSIQALETVSCPVVPRDRPILNPGRICTMPQMLRSRQQVFESTGGLHAAALFDSSGNLTDLREDVGRHNAVDKLIGAAFLKGLLPLNDHVLMLSGRASFELVQKAVMAGIGAVVAVGAPSSLAVELAERFGITLIGFTRSECFNVYFGEFRLRMPSAADSSSEDHAATARP